MAKLRDELAGNEWTSSDRTRWLTRLDGAETEFLQIEVHAKLQCEDANREVKGASINAGWLGPTGGSLKQQMQKYIEVYRHNEELLMLCLLGRAVVAQFRIGLGVHVAADVLRQDINFALQASGAHETLVSERAIEFTTKFRSGKFEIAARKELRDDAKKFRAGSRLKMENLLGQLANVDSQKSHKVTALVEVTDGTVRDVKLVG